MTILHIARITNDLCSGVCVAVPQHVAAQQKTANVGFVNISSCDIDGITNQFHYETGFHIHHLPAPFCNPDLVVFHEVYIPAFVKIAFELVRAHIPYIIVPHGSLSFEAQNKKWLKKRLGNLLLFNYYIKRASAVQCLSAREAENIRFSVNKFVGTNGVVTPPVQKEFFEVQALKFVFVGRYEVHIKGIDLLLNAVKENECLFRQNNVTLHMYGPDTNGGYEAVCSLVHTLGISDIVFVNLEVTGKQKEKVLLDADIFVQTSRTEGMPMGVLEALSYGVPCLVTHGTNVAKLISEHDAGFSCETSSRGVATAMKEVIAAKDTLYRKARNAIALIDQHFEWDRVASDTLASYEHILKANMVKNCNVYL